MGKGWKLFQNADWMNKLNVRAEYGLTGNTRFSSKWEDFIILPLLICNFQLLFVLTYRILH